MEGETTAVFLGAGPEERDEFCTVERLLEQKRAMERREELRRISMMRRVSFGVSRLASYVYQVCRSCFVYRNNRLLIARFLWRLILKPCRF